MLSKPVKFISRQDASSLEPEEIVSGSSLQAADNAASPEGFGKESTTDGLDTETKGSQSDVVENESLTVATQDIPGFHNIQENLLTTSFLEQ
ncbi:hypothetical protein BV25DRAFT_1827274 [Artomyces pyxidatus]|uniref:Uncharacterized protein n=2 Tax=Artomyces pyxidatus TaxID=48021 RepID=A0ACB8SP03_9AGAM|nr:hypothetical protein BV25DRAFT_1831137 [Artomyces pyxidatus]KAI0061032.1 hypothetical protein BV25DRAFT_1827274 [Artomyces pyxidatus]